MIETGRTKRKKGLEWRVGWRFGVSTIASRPSSITVKPMVAASRSLPCPSLPLSQAPGRLLEWCRREPLTAFLATACLAALIYFFGFYKVFLNGQHSVAVWAWQAWNPENNQEHSALVLPISLFLVWLPRGKLANARIAPWNPGLLVVAFGVGCYVLSVRSLQ
ncbi:MAG: archaeosortase/exosortase family protein, partial [Chthoniobacteraceae bacterium]